MVAVLAVWLTHLGIGSIVLWAFGFAWVQFGALGTLMSRERLWQTIGSYIWSQPYSWRSPFGDGVTVLWSGEQHCEVGEPLCAGTWFGIHVPIPQTVVHTSLFVAVLSGLYFTVSTSVDPLYRQRFFDPLIADVAVSLTGRDAYLEMEEHHDRAR